MQGQSEASYQPATTLSPFALVVCSRCRRGYKDSLDLADSFYLTDCSHTLCHTCVSEAPPGQVEGTVQCPECRHEGQLMRLDPEGDMDGLRHCFRPLRSLLDELGMSLEYQFGNVVEQLAFFKGKAESQRQVLSKLGGELKKLRKVASRFEGLEEENAALRAQLAAAAQGRSASTQSTSARSGGRQELSGFHVDTRQGGVERSHKRRAIDSPGGPAPRSAPQTSATSRTNYTSNLPLQPARLSLSPAHAQAHSEKQHHANLQRASSTRPGPISSTAKDRIAFAFDPTKRQQNSSSRPSPAPPTPSRQAFQHVQLSSRTYQPQQQIHYQHQPQVQYLDNSLDARPNQEMYPEPCFQATSFDYQPQSPAPPSPRHQPSFAGLGSGSTQRTPFEPPSRGITPMPLPQRPRSTSSTCRPPIQQPPPTPQRQPFQPRSDPRAGASTPRPTAPGGFTYREPTPVGRGRQEGGKFGLQGGGFASQMR